MVDFLFFFYLKKATNLTSNPQAIENQIIDESELYLRENTEEGLNMVTRDGITDKSPPFVPHFVKELLRIKPREIAIARLPSP